MKILLVDDDSKIRNLASEIILKKIKAEIFHAENGNEGLDYLKKEKCDLVILDNDMPVMNGYEFLGKVRSVLNLKKLPVIVLTASNDSQTVSRYLNLDVTNYVLKPFQANDLINKINSSVSVRKKLLMIDDNSAFKLFIEKIIVTRFSSVDFLTAGDGNEGLNQVIEHRPDLILLDINMPEMTGIEFLQKLRGEYSEIDIPIIMLTSVNDKETVKLMAQHKVLDYILKPVNISDFSSKISKVLNINKL